MLSGLKSVESDYEVPASDSLGVIESKLDQPGVYEAVDDNASVSKRTWSDAYDHKPKTRNDYEIPVSSAAGANDIDTSVKQPHYDIATDTTSQQPHYDIATDTSSQQPHYDIATDTTKSASLASSSAASYPTTAHYDLASPPEEVPSFTFGFAGAGVGMADEEDFA